MPPGRVDKLFLTLEVNSDDLSSLVTILTVSVFFTVPLTKEIGRVRDTNDRLSMCDESTRKENTGDAGLSAEQLISGTDTRFTPSEIAINGLCEWNDIA